ncbi:acyl-CoA dehydrogenase family protein [Sphingosinicella microcystinivorans]|uniref:Acyl-CoA dehydrogenase n=1 Tax=Sphingosinicella microcystinivorans TaxID=335406 RepID=A0AAD1D2B4_SPHMI|nr:acyl-CoA dehydrogenase family protein [Sphingosinicella microcystinivorans]RKS88706.1 alkylation response protein AidB-like acyl-CoA dehydrogenase [Sphingosinicella microcystinivorans]BBE32460.1 acyl-CoA dehydrogenase [Sphingosinicella microcystinivorans]
MEFDFTEEYRLLADQLRRALEVAAPLDAARKTVDSGQLNRSAWGLLSEMGILASGISADFGGNDLGSIPVCLASEAIGWSVAAVPTESLYHATPLIQSCGSADQRTHWLPALASGEATGCVATGAVLAIHNDRLTGAVSPVSGGHEASVAIVRADNRLWLVDLTASDIEREQLATLDPGRPLCRIAFRGTPATPMVSDTSDFALNHAVVCVAFEQIGGASRALDGAIAYARERQAFGHSIGSYQAIKHKLTDIWTRIEIARAHAMYAASSLDTRASDLPLAAAAARAAATEAYLFAAQETLQVHGGYGFTFEADSHLFYRRARALAASFGPAIEWRSRLAARLIAGETALH